MLHTSRFLTQQAGFQSRLILTTKALFVDAAHLDLQSSFFVGSILEFLTEKHAKRRKELHWKVQVKFQTQNQKSQTSTAKRSAKELL